MEKLIIIPLLYKHYIKFSSQVNTNFRSNK